MDRKLAENGVRSTAGGAAAISAYADLYDVILNPFGVVAVDLTQVELTDVPEDSEYYDAVRFVFENQIMAPRGEDTFGVDDTATAGDLMAAIYVCYGYTPNAPEDARAWLAGFNLVDPEMDLDTELNEEFLCHIFANGVGVGISTDTPEELVSRGDLADLLFQVFASQPE